MRNAFFWKKCTPSVGRHWLRILAGLLWSVTGLFLCAVACYWFYSIELTRSLLGVLLGFSSGVLIYRFGFSRIARKNIERIARQPQSVCLFAFQAWRSYLLIIFMMFLGYALRHSPIPRIVTAVIYSAIGTGLTLSSSLYYGPSMK